MNNIYLHVMVHNNGKFEIDIVSYFSVRLLK